MNRGLYNEYFELVRDALRAELKRDPDENEILEYVNKLIGKWYES